jgi:hypothetical protein
MGLGGPAKTVYQPFRCEVRRRADRQHARTLTLHEMVCPDRDPIERVAHDTEIFAPRPCNRQALALAIEELDAEFRLQRLDLMTHSTLRDTQLFGGSGETLMACCSLKSLEGIQRRQTAKHPRTLMRKTKAR